MSALQPMPKPAARGIAMVEFVIVLPLLLLIMIATAEFGRAFLHYNALTKALQDGSRFAASRAGASGGATGIPAWNPGDVADIRNVVVYGQVDPTVGSPPPEPLLPGLVPGNVAIVITAAGEVDLSIAYTFTAIFASIPMFGIGPDITPDYTFRVNHTVRPI